MKGDPLETFKNSRKKVSQSQNNMSKKFFDQRRDSNPRPSAWQTSNNPQKSETEVTLVWQLVLVQISL